MALEGYYIKPKGFDADSDSREVSHKTDTAVLMWKTAVVNHCKAAFICN